jgi:hypothetical protein
MGKTVTRPTQLYSAHQGVPFHAAHLACVHQPTDERGPLAVSHVRVFTVYSLWCAGPALPCSSSFQRSRRAWELTELREARLLGWRER